MRRLIQLSTLSSPGIHGTGILGMYLQTIFHRMFKLNYHDHTNLVSPESYCCFTNIKQTSHLTLGVANQLAHHMSQQFNPTCSKVYSPQTKKGAHPFNFGIFVFHYLLTVA